MAVQESHDTTAPLPSRIAFISVDGDPAIDIGGEEAGGQNVYVRQVGEALAALGWTIDLFTRQSSPEQAPIIEHGPRCRTIRLQAGPMEFLPRNELFEHLPAFVAQWLQFQTQQGSQYALIHTHYWLSSWVGMTLKAHQSLVQVHTYHSVGAVKYRTVPDIPAIAATRMAVEKQCLETVDRIVATSPQEKSYLHTLISPQGQLTIIPCGTDTKRFGSVSQAEARARLEVPAAQKVVFYVGRFDPRKGIETLVRAIAQSSFRHSGELCLIIGGGSRPGYTDGRERDRIEKLVHELGLSDIVQFPGRISDADLPLYYAAATVCAVPSHYEPFGLVAIEAMASGTPVVASDVGGLQFTVIPEQTGLLVCPQDVKTLAHALDRILADPIWRHQLGQTAQKRVQTEFSWPGVAQQLSNLYQDLLSTPA
ncbi:MAG: glycosyltransferase family 1 protein [Thermosynechococcaceae cyanobacterium]